MSDKTTFTSTAKQTSRGIQYAVFANGKEIGGRTTGKRVGFKFAVVARRDYAHTCKRTRESLKYQEEELVKYQGYLDNPAEAVRKERLKHTNYHTENLSKWIVDGTVAKWLEHTRQNIVKDTARLLELSGMTQESPEFSEWLVIGFSNTGKETPKEWNYAFQFVTLTQPPGVETV